MLNFLCFFVLFDEVKTDTKLTLHHMGKIFYYLTYEDKIKNLEGYIFKKFFYHEKIIGMDFWFSRNRQLTMCASRWDEFSYLLLHRNLWRTLLTAVF